MRDTFKPLPARVPEDTVVVIRGATLNTPGYGVGMWRSGPGADLPLLLVRGSHMRVPKDQLRWLPPWSGAGDA